MRKVPSNTFMVYMNPLWAYDMIPEDGTSISLVVFCNSTDFFDDDIAPVGPFESKNLSNLLDGKLFGSPVFISESNSMNSIDAFWHPKYIVLFASHQHSEKMSPISTSEYIVCVSFNSTTSHTFTRESEPPEKRNFSSDDFARHSTEPVWPLDVPLLSNVSMSRTMIWWS